MYTRLCFPPPHLINRESEPGDEASPTHAKLEHVLVRAAVILPVGTPRWGHFSAGVGEQLYLWGGRTKDFAKEKAVLSRRTHCWDPVLECWQHKECSGLLPPALYDGACASIAHHLYLYGGRMDQLGMVPSTSWTPSHWSGSSSLLQAP